MRRFKSSDRLHVDVNENNMFLKSSIVVGGLRPLVQTELSTQNFQQKSN